jgi:hypothetical protein
MQKVSKWCALSTKESIILFIMENIALLQKLVCE